MRRPLSLVLATLALVASACGGGDDSTASSETADEAEAADPAAVTIPDVGDRCEDQPDPADYVEGEIPPPIRPCVIPTELVVHTIHTGTGRIAEPGDRLIVNYTGIRAEDGIIFDTSYIRPVPFDFPLGRGGVIQGWDDGLVDVQAGALVKLDIPSELAYGDTPPGDEIKPGDALSFVIEVEAVIPSVCHAVTADEPDRILPGPGDVVGANGKEVIHDPGAGHVVVVRGEDDAGALQGQDTRRFHIAAIGTDDDAERDAGTLEDGKLPPGLEVGVAWEGLAVGPQTAATVRHQDLTVLEVTLTR
jgi:peptidylprolyl isomerase